MRPKGWESLLSERIALARTREFAWGTHDCVLWCADWIQKITGNDPATEWRGKYASEQEAVAILKSMGLTTWSGLADTHLPVIPVARARRGDVMLHPAGMLGICDGPHAYFVTERGVTRIEFMKCLKAWAVG